MLPDLRADCCGAGTGATANPCLCLGSTPANGREIASRRLPHPDTAIVEDDTREQRQQQRATCHNKAHTPSPCWNGVSVPRAPVKSDEGRVASQLIRCEGWALRLCRSPPPVFDTTLLASEEWPEISRGVSEVFHSIDMRCLLWVRSAAGFDDRPNLPRGRDVAVDRIR
jgi:hypothetical protein